MVDSRTPESRIRIGISSCLLGQKVRFDAGHKHDRFITDVLGPYFEFVPVCPELEVGMGVPRESVKLQGNPEAPLMVGNKSGKDWTARMNRYADRRVRRRDMTDFSGYILKKDSPSCGMERVKVYGESGMPERRGRGLFAAALMRQHPLLPVEEEGRLNDFKIRENFIVRVFAYHRLRILFKSSFRRGELVRFHAAHKYLLLAHSPKHHKLLGQLAANMKRYEVPVFREKYSALFMEALKMKSTARKNVNVLHHILGFLKDHIDPSDKRDILQVIEDYRNELVPLIVPVTLLKHYVNKHGIEYIQDQIYLNPHPKELMLRNHV
ncbi:MAG: DUF1722 domain-containing protein [Candidatus Latescibacteria bacterium]|nr:DUF1722 domain-containing protein [Candidatus Latescibacterota bacterium]NIM64748.1 DUF1722 domain-containing protein [Candidatus Latescibacterota bacterium]NIO01258.1 DUF1722 domain-containing protein [Candidatus Latescibacterota bacterium]NIO27643.1 DUF1722 domain-containing protein [Candidatus Latescibacterota bacterium]NIO55175.1 DUF1722 domain-containing protein [Candidatus Latescibacterota bacterium]